MSVYCYLLLVLHWRS